MRLCNQCHRITAGQPLFCNYCGRTYDVKLCPHRHPNPRHAETCSQCGSRDLSVPHPRFSFWLSFLLGIASFLPGLLLLGLTTWFFLGFLTALATDQRPVLQAMLTGLMLAFLWYLYLQLPSVLRRFISKLFHRSHKDDHGH